MKLNLDVVPKNLDEAVNILLQSIETEAEKDGLKDTVGLHFGFGRWLRNSWSLWERDTILVQWFEKNLGISHADDISSTILEALKCLLAGEEFNAKNHVQVYITHWKKMGIDPITGVKV